MASGSQLQVPPEPFMLDLFQHWQQSPEAIVIRDHSVQKKDFTVAEFLRDVLSLRKRIFDSLGENAKSQLSSPDTDVFVAILAAPGYGFSALFFAVYSLGAVAVPLSPVVLLEEAEYLLKICGCALLVTVPTEERQAKIISDTFGFNLLAYDPVDPRAPSTVSFSLDSESPGVPPEKGFILLYTSGTTGRPKGVLHSRSAAHIGLQSQVESFGLTGSDTWLHHHPVHWGAGCTLSVVVIISHACLEFCSAQFSTDWLLTRLQDGDATCLYLPPFDLDALANKIDDWQRAQTQSQEKIFLSGIRNLRILCSGGVRVSPAIQAVWRDIRGGKPLVVVYAMTELLSLASITDWRDDKILPAGCCGSPTPNLEVKINDAGDIFVRGPALFKRYLSENASIMKDVFDSEGFFRTGDFGRLDGDNLFVFGRADNDVIRVFLWKAYAPELEDELSHHPQISQATVLGVPHSTAGQSIAALIRMQGHTGKDQPTARLGLSELRRWLTVERDLPMFRLPTMLRVIEVGETLPTTLSSKIQKAKVRDLFSQAEIESGKVEVCDLFDNVPDREKKPFDWSALQSTSGFAIE
ncbi:hypothetical protein FQN54_008022 [Arachnomyces sp. PD_36]|nr:hypothetical protein FQN54_008022 [Arachnomyces sp. PD_36]